jgi:rod shape-determining protein MreD
VRWVRVGLLWLVLAVLAVRDPGGIAASGFAPYWFLLPALLAGLRARAGHAVFLAWCSGLAADLFSLEPFGLHAFLYGGSALLLVRIREYFFCDHALTQAVLSFGLSVLVGIALLLRLEIAEPVFRFGPRLPQAFLTALVTACLLPPLAIAERNLGLLSGFREESRLV